MKLEFYKPKNAVLQKYLEGYYFISPDNSATALHYWTFPNNFFIVSISLNIEMEMEDHKFIIKRSKQENTMADFVARYKAPIEIIYQEAVYEVTLYFKPLGINHFISNVHSLLKREHAKDFDPYPDFKQSMNGVLGMQDREQQREALENYWLSKLMPQDLQLMESLLADMESDLKIDEMAQKYTISRQYLNTLFKKHIGKSPSEYRKIYRFRKALEKKKDTKNLTDLTHQSLFYDQSHMIKDFKELTSISPYSFFKKVDTQKENIWLFI